MPIGWLIAVNNNGAFCKEFASNGGAFQVGKGKFRGGTPRAQAEILIHELAHLLIQRELLPPGAQQDGFWRDYFDNAAQNRNSDLVDKKCRAIINLFPREDRSMPSPRRRCRTWRAAAVTAAAILLSATCAERPSAAQMPEMIPDDQVKVVSFEDLAYPPIAIAAKIGGVVVVEVTLDDVGNVTAASPISGANVLVPPSVANARKWKFEPNAQKRAVIVYHFRIEGTCKDSSPSLFRIIHFNFASITACGRVL